MSATTGPQLGVTLYSFNNDYYQYTYSFEDCMKQAGAISPGQGVEIVGPMFIREFPDVSAEFVARFRRAVDTYGLKPMAYGAYADYQRFTGRLATKQELSAYYGAQFRAAHQMGFPVVRVQPAAPVFDDLLPLAEKLGLVMGIEVHAPTDIAHGPGLALVERVEQINSPHLGLVPDFGIFAQRCAPVYRRRFLELGVKSETMDLVEELWAEGIDIQGIQREVRKHDTSDMALLAALESCVYFGHSDPKAWQGLVHRIVHIHGKFFHIDENGDEPAVRYAEMLTVLRNGNYSGSMVSEYEGHHWAHTEDAFTQIKRHQALVQRLWDSPRG